MTTLGTKTINGTQYRYESKISWQRRYYSFDGGRNWFESKKQAFDNATARNLTCSVNQHYVTTPQGRAVVNNVA